MMKNQLAGLMKQAQQMQENMQRAQEELARTEVEGQSGAGMVKVVMTCRHDVKRVAIDPSVFGFDVDAAQRRQRGERGVDDDRGRSVQIEIEILFVLVLLAEHSRAARGRGDGREQDGQKGPAGA